MTGPKIEYDQEVLDMAQAAANVRNERDALRKEVEVLKAEAALLTARLGERHDQINRLESQLLIATMRNGQQVSIIEQIEALAKTWHGSVEASSEESLTRQ
jgi:hypothetical protein